MAVSLRGLLLAKQAVADEPAASRGVTGPLPAPRARRRIGCDDNRRSARPSLVPRRRLEHGRRPVVVVRERAQPERAVEADSDPAAYEPRPDGRPAWPRDLVLFPC